MNVGSPGTDGMVAPTTISPNGTETGGRGSWLDRWLTIPPLHGLLLVVAKLDPHKVRESIPSLLFCWSESAPQSPFTARVPRTAPRTTAYKRRTSPTRRCPRTASP